ncbi:MAG: UDP-N-acetylmuramate dehydrogenase [Bacteroidota bacterium]
MNAQHNVSLKPFNTFGLDATAKTFYKVQSENELLEALNQIEISGDDFVVFGGGSNLLLTSDINGTVIKNSILGKEVIRETEENVFVQFGAGENWHESVLYAIDNDWGGIENLSLIPGTMGAAPMQNIGAYGIEICNVFHELTALEISSGKLQKFNNEDCQFGYRESIFKNKKKGKFIITDVTLRLTKSDHIIDSSYGAIKDVLSTKGIKDPGIRDISNAVIEIRQSKLPDPKKIGNAGSFFKNPTIDKIDFEGLKAEFSGIPGYELPEEKVKVPAAWLIEQCGWKGIERNKIGVHKKQALVLVNYGGGSGNELKELAFEIRQSVADKFGIELHPEVNII